MPMVFESGRNSSEVRHIFDAGHRSSGDGGICNHGLPFLDVDECPTPNKPPQLRLGDYGGALSTILEAAEPESTTSNHAVASHVISPSTACFRRSKSLPTNTKKADLYKQDQLALSSSARRPHRWPFTLSKTNISDSNLIQLGSPNPCIDSCQEQSAPPRVSYSRRSSWHSNTDTNSVDSTDSSCDSKGRCINHPHIRLRKKKFFGSEWKIKYTTCPDCCVEQLLSSLHATDNEFEMNASRYLMSMKSSSTRSLSLSISSRSVDSHMSFDSNQELSTLNQHQPEEGNDLQDCINRDEEENVIVQFLSEINNRERAIDPVYVGEMEYIDNDGKSGRYSGTINASSEPHGTGVMVYDDGEVAGVWKNGECLLSM